MVHPDIAHSQQQMDPEIAGWLARTAHDPEPTTLHEVRERTRRNNELALAAMNPAIRPHSEQDTQIDTVAGALPIRILRPAGDGPHPTVAYFHGGGWTVGGIETHLGHARQICVQADAVVVSVGYRLAPENRFPAAFDDALAATEWVAQHQADLGGAGPDGALAPLVVAGDSAGGQLAASVAIARRDAGQRLDAQLLLYPVTDVAGRYEDPEINRRYMSRRTVRQTSGLTLEGMRNFAHHYVDAADAGDWRVSPIRCADLSGVAPAVIHTATLDVLRTEGNFYADALRRDGVEVISREFPTLNHSYFGLGGVSAMAESAAAQAAEDLLQILARVCVG